MPAMLGFSRFDQVRGSESVHWALLLESDLYLLIIG